MVRLGRRFSDGPHSTAAHRAARGHAPDCKCENRRDDYPEPAPYPLHLDPHHSHPAVICKQESVAVIPRRAKTPGGFMQA